MRSSTGWIIVSYSSHFKINVIIVYFITDIRSRQFQIIIDGVLSALAYCSVHLIDIYQPGFGQCLHFYASPLPNLLFILFNTILVTIIFWNHSHRLNT